MMPPADDGLDLVLVEAINHHHASRFDEAEKLYRNVLDAPPGHAVASFGFGLLCATRGRPLEAIKAYRRAIAMRPDFVGAYINLGTVFLTLGQHEDAVTQYRRAITISPENTMALGNLGKALQDLGRIDEAIAAYRVAIAHQPDNAIVQVNLGAALLAQQAWVESITATRRAIDLCPDNAMAYANLGTALMHLEQRDQALAACRQAIALHPRDVSINASLGGAMLELGALPEAIALCRQAITLDPGQANAHFNLSHALKAMNHLPEAALAARQAIALRPDTPEYHFHLAHILLLLGELDEGWVEYDWRWKLQDFAWISELHGEFRRPPWAGEDICSKTILIYTEQGLGDVILFTRYLPLIVRRAGRVIVAVQPRMRGLLEKIQGITVVSIREIPLPDFDMHCPLLTLPRIFETRLDTIPAEVPYLTANAVERSRWERRIGGDAFRVGIVWAGNPATKRDHFRSPGLANVMPLFAVPGVEFVVLQVGPGRDDLGTIPLPPHVMDLGEEIADLTDTAAIMTGLDLVISSCTAPLHLAGALGVRTWAMLPFVPYFPWLLERTDTPWYPTMTLYRQEQPGRDWSCVVSRIAADLAVLVRSGSARYDVSAPKARQSVPADESPQGAAPDRSLKMGPTMSETFNELAQCRGGLMLYNRNDTYIGASMRKYGEFSGEETALFRVIVQPGRTVLDVGANIGVHTVELSRLTGPAGVVHAFEPQRLIYQVLCANVALNSLANVFTHHAAAGSAGGSLLVPALDPGGRHNYGGVSLLGSPRGERVPMLTIDSLDLGDCQFIKLDVEGMETEALRGAEATIGRFRPILYVENDRQARSAELISVLFQYGYRLYWHLPPIYTANNFRSDTENIFGDKVSVNMICIPAEIAQSSLTNLREVTNPSDSVIQW